MPHTNDESALLVTRFLEKLRSRKNQIPDDLYTYLAERAAEDRVDNPLAERWERLIDEAEPSRQVLFGVDAESAVATVPFHGALLPLICAHAAGCPDPFASMNAAHDGIVSNYAAHQCRELSEIARYVLFTDLCQFGSARFLSTAKGQRKPTYEGYIRDLFADGWRRIGVAYPVLAHWLVQRMDAIARNAGDLAMRFSSDFAEISELFGNFDSTAAKPTVSDIEFGLSDPHAGGASTIMLEIERSTSIFYKPKSMANERWFNEDFLASFQPNGFKVIAVVDCGSHGWAQDANTPESPATSATPDVGESIAIAYVLNATDLHCENVLITDGGMAWIDLEMLFTPPTTHDLENGGGGVSCVDSGLIWSNACRNPLKRDPSGLFGSGVFDILPKVRFMANDMDGVTVDFDESANRESSFRTRRALPLNTLDPAAVARSFSDAVVRLRDDDRLPGVLDRANGGRVRYVFRPTAFYYRLRHKLLQPRYLRSARAQTMELLQLFEECAGLEPSDAMTMAALIKSEISQMNSGDIPVFWSDYESRDLDSPVGVVCPSYFAVTPKESVTQKLRAQTDRTIEEQANILRTIIEVSQDLNITSDDQGASLDSKASQQPAPIRVLLDKLTEDLLDRAFLTSDEITSWVSFHGAVDGDRLFPRADVYTPYGGSFGVLYFLSCMHDSQSCAGSIHDRLTDFLGDIADSPTGTAGRTALARALAKRPGLDGLGGLFVAASQGTPRCAKLFGDLVESVLSDRTIDIVQSLELEPSGDIINGAAGMTIGLATYIRSQSAMHAPARVDVAVRLLVACLQSILERPDDKRKSSVWFASPASFSHGRLGFAAALADGYTALAALGRQPPSLEGRVRAFMDESLHECAMHPEQLPSSAIAELDNTSWCHGQAGVGYAHLLLSRLDSCYLETAGLVATSLMSRPTHAIDCFCCGGAGVAEFLRLYGTVANDTAAHASGEERVAAIASQWHRTGRFAGSWGPTRSAQFPGYFQGASGLGLSLLNSLDPSFVSLGMPFGDD